MTTSISITELEQIAFNAWIAREIEELGGWFLRSNDGITRRANSVLPLRAPSRSVSEAIDYAIKFYRDRNIIPRFQINPACVPENLDSVLEDSGFFTELVVSIQTADITNLSSVESSWDVTIESSPSDRWLKGYGKAAGYNERSLQVRKGIMERIKQDKAFASVIVDNEVIGVGISVVESQWAGLFGLVTLEKYKKKGIATAINQALATWAQKLGVKDCYLQVELRNKIAKAFYNNLGFREFYTYWYRQLSE